MAYLDNSVRFLHSLCGGSVLSFMKYILYGLSIQSDHDGEGKLNTGFLARRVSALANPPMTR